MFDVSGIPGDNQIRNVVDEMEPAALNPAFNETLKTWRAGVINGYRVLDGGVLLALDGLWYVSSENIHCDHCLTKTVKGKKGNRGYNLEHNFGYGSNHAADIFFLLNSMLYLFALLLLSFCVNMP